MIATEKTALELKVEAVNYQNRRINSMREWLNASLQDWVGKKVRTVSGYGAWVAKLRPEMDAVVEEFSGGDFHAHVWFQASDYSLWAHHKVRIDREHGCDYLERSIYIGKCVTGGYMQAADGVLQDLRVLEEGDKLRTDWTVDEVLALQARERAAFEAHQAARKALSTFTQGNG